MKVKALSLEEWRSIPSYEGYYEVSNKGRVRSLKRRFAGAKIMSPNIDKRGRCRLELCRYKEKPKKFFVSNLILKAFVGPRPKGFVACHKDDNPQNNTLNNLRWDTQKSNIADSWRNGRQGPGLLSSRAKLTRDQILEIRNKKNHQKLSTEFANIFGVSIHTINRVRLGLTYKDVI